jgi:hypothetical protein
VAFNQVQVRPKLGFDVNGHLVPVADLMELGKLCEKSLILAAGPVVVTGLADIAGASLQDRVVAKALALKTIAMQHVADSSGMSIGVAIVTVDPCIARPAPMTGAAGAAARELRPWSPL